MVTVVVITNSGASKAQGSVNNMLTILLVLFSRNVQTSALRPSNHALHLSMKHSFLSDRKVLSTNKALTDLQQRAGPIASSFEPSAFNPISFLNNCHIQTIGAFLVRDIPYCANVVNPGKSLLAMIQRATTLKDISFPFWEKRVRFDTPDGDFFDVDYTFSANAKGMVVILHGLESNSKSSLTQQMATAYAALDLDVCCLNFRGCSGEPNLTIGGYHLGFTTDLVQFLDSLGPRPPPIYLSGFSLGGNCVLKALGELEASAVETYNIQGAATFCVPMDNERNAPCLGQPGFNRGIYTNNLLRTLRRKAQDQLDQFCNGDESTSIFDFRGAVNAQTITDFDDAFIAPIYGFENAIDYYRKTSSAYFLESIAVPTLLLNAKDDPFMDPDFFPSETSWEHGGPAPVKMVRTNHGGHLGYVFHQVNGGEPIPETSWGPAEMARFLKHVMESSTTS
jgi:uncharacterized protein